MGGPKIQETNEQVQQRLRARAEQTRSIQKGVSDRTRDNSRRFNPRASLITGGVSRRAAL